MQDSDALLKDGDAEPSWADGRFSEGVEFRIQALVNFATVATFIAGFALTDLSSMEWDVFENGSPVLLGESYIVLMSFAAGCAACNAVLGILLVVTYQRIKSWDRVSWKKYQLQRAGFERSETKNFQTYISVFGDPGQEKYSKDVFKRMYDSERAPMRMSMQLFPWAVASYICAVATKVTASSAGSGKSVLAQFVCPAIIIPFALLMLFFARKLMQLVVS